MNRIQRWTVILTLGILVASPAAAQATVTLKIGVFDPQRVAQESAQGKRLQAKITELQSRKQSEIATKGQRLQQLEKTYGEQALSLSEDRRTAMQLEIERLKLEVENARQLAGQELQLEFAGAQSSFNEMLIKGIGSFGRSEGFDLILDLGAVAWAGDSIDVTTAIIDRFDAMFPVGDTEGGGE